MIYILFVMDRCIDDAYDNNGDFISYGQTIFETRFVTIDIALLKAEMESLKSRNLDHYVEVWTNDGLYKGRMEE
jgi:hypothetical protein